MKKLLIVVVAALFCAAAIAAEGKREGKTNPKAGKANVKALFKRIDVNGDGVITVEEAQKSRLFRRAEGKGGAGGAGKMKGRPQQLTPEQRQKMRARWQQLPPEHRQRMRQMWQRVSQLPPEKRKQVIEKFRREGQGRGPKAFAQTERRQQIAKKLRQATPEQRQQIFRKIRERAAAGKGAFQKGQGLLQQIPPERRQKVIQKLKALPPEERKKQVQKIRRKLVKDNARKEFLRSLGPEQREQYLQIIPPEQREKVKKFYEQEKRSRFLLGLNPRQRQLALLMAEGDQRENLGNFFSQHPAGAQRGQWGRGGFEGRKSYTPGHPGREKMMAPGDRQTKRPGMHQQGPRMHGKGFAPFRKGPVGQGRMFERGGPGESQRRQMRHHPEGLRAPLADRPGPRREEAAPGRDRTLMQDWDIFENWDLLEEMGAFGR